MDRVATIASADGIIEEVSVSEKSVDGDALVVDEVGRREGMVLVELPREAASGRWRVWVSDSALAAPPAGAPGDA